MEDGTTISRRVLAPMVHGIPAKFIVKEDIYSWPPRTQGGSILIADKTMPRGLWPRGRIVKTIPGRDNKVRIVEIQTKLGILKRPTSRLRPQIFLDPSPHPPWFSLEPEVVEIRDSGGFIHGKVTPQTRVNNRPYDVKVEEHLIDCNATYTFNDVQNVPYCTEGSLFGQYIQSEKDIEPLREIAREEEEKGKKKRI
ncbi:hypothetical protein EVAR_12654_1 [Eumeta japonica]|uniref:DUF5641 domain-containing protein n=1 Tax=Eumeta variegata TaxID=151549 RepID=A0A4C1ZD29_EUMVA|nr:hypothetical protein EVAR_12654_1 [Eumeta japonica]